MPRTWSSTASALVRGSGLSAGANARLRRPACSDYSEYVVLPDKNISTVPLRSPSVNFSAALSSFATVSGARRVTLAFVVDATYAVRCEHGRTMAHGF
jgi:hypothetical protein